MISMPKPQSQARIHGHRLGQKVQAVLEPRAGVLPSLSQQKTPRAQLGNQQKPPLKEIVRLVLEDFWASYI